MPLSSVDKVRQSANAEYARVSRSAANGNAASADDRARGDSVEISDAARRLSEAGNQPDPVENARRRVSSGFYNRPEVLRQIAANLAKDIKENK